MAKSEAPRSVKQLRKDEWSIVEKVEFFSFYANRNIDLMGFVDVWAFDHQRGHLFVQVTSRGHISTRKKKILEDHLDDAYELVKVPYNRIVIHGWDKPKHRWRLKEVDISEDIQQAWLKENK